MRWGLCGCCCVFPAFVPTVLQHSQIFHRIFMRKTLNVSPLGVLVWRNLEINIYVKSDTSVCCKTIHELWFFFFYHKIDFTGISCYRLIQSCVFLWIGRKNHGFLNMNKKNRKLWYINIQVKGFCSTGSYQTHWQHDCTLFL